MRVFRSERIPRHTRDWQWRRSQGRDAHLIVKMKIDRDADLEKIGILVPGQDEDVQQELDTYVELGQRRGRGTQVSLVVC